MKFSLPGLPAARLRALLKLLLIMKLVFVLLIASFLHVSAKSYSQTLTLQKEVTLERLFREIHKQCGFDVVCDAALLQGAKPVQVNFRQENLETVLQQVLAGQQLSYTIKDRVIVIRRAPQPARQLRVTGRVSNERGEPMSGVNVLHRESKRAVTSGENGTFSIEIPAAGGALVFSFVGYQSQEITVPASGNLLVTLQPQAQSMEEVVVLGYGTQKRSDVNASIVSIKPEIIDKTAQPSIDQMLQGQAAGLTVVNSSQPGGGTVVNIRGATSTGAGNGPLVVIDGFPVIYDPVEPGSGNKYNNGSRGALNDINPNDIASIEILKDASATAIYGARGSNGVILITTKRGRQGSSIEYNLNTSVQEITRAPELLNATEFMVEQNKYLYELYLIQNKVRPYGNTDPSAIPGFIARNSPAVIQAAGQGTNWFDMITQTGKINQHNLQISRGNETTKALFSANYFGQDGIIKGSGMDRYSFRLNLDQKITKWWDYGTSLTGALTKSQNSQLGDGRDADAGIIEAALNYSPTIGPARDPASNKWIEDPNQPLLGHPLSYLEITDNTDIKRMLANVFTNVYFSPAIWLKLNVGGDIRSSLRQSYYPKTSRYGSQVNGEADINRAERNDYVTDLTLNFRKDLAGVHNLQGVIGYSYQAYHGSGSAARAQNFASDALLYDALGAGAQRPVVSSYRDRHILASYFTRLQYGFKSRYLFTFSARVDGSDRFGRNNRYAFFPSGAFAWRLIEEPFIRSSKTLSDLKLRISVGKVGNENISNSAASEFYGFNGMNYYFNGNLSNGVSLSKLGNPNLKWESTTAYNLGLDFGLFRNRLSGTVEVYYKNVSDLLSYRALPQSSVVGNIPWNIGSTRGRGLEVSLNAANLTGRFQWNTLVTFTSFSDRWKERDPKVILQAYQGDRDPLTAVFGLVADGIKQAGENTPAMPGLLPGQQKYRDVNGLGPDGKLTGVPDGKINQADVVFLGTRAPRFSMGMNNAFSYKGFDLNVFVYAAVGGLKWAATRMEHSVYGSYGTQLFRSNYNFLREVQNRWTSTNTNTDMPSGEVNSYDSYGSPYWEKASYLRLKSLTLGYNFASSALRVKWLKGARLFAGGQNLFTITGYKGLDPESENDRATYPQQRTLSVGLDVKF
ncbi:SusC/RagA family TonB-linked outer membrane protein [Pedobacter yulinensis]|uniref:SusC/RagA family TonB-linked outer membrane protein n=1 Tax=Pedobacter yulinensis TaxID=2126353 RepID=A0A2T3HHH3_9SPHI|nr:TonB-dependent receptor [Pedobacter yulinensis]PST81831.1 SusC/RagA family TonB-linked outer membrane protein [Pedobacter yulinensis]